MSDPVSVEVGIGPECRKHYSAEVLRAVRSKQRSLVRAGSVRETEWLAMIHQVWLSETAPS